MSDEPADEKQVSVAELLARNGQRVGAAGGRRRRGMAGGISVAELTGEIPVVQDEPREEQQPEAPAEPPAPETPPAESPAPETPAERPVAKTEAPERPAPEPSAPEPSAPEPPAPERPVAETEAPAAPAPKTPEVKRPEPRFPPRPQPGKAPVKAPVWPTDGDIPDRPSKSTMDKSRTFAMTEVEVDEEAGHEPDAAETTLLPKTVVAPATLQKSAVVDDPATDAHEVVEAPVEPDETTELQTDDTDDREPAAPVATGKRSPLRQWAGIVGQGLVAIVLGALLFKGFERLWDVLPWVALVLAFFVIVGLVAVVRVLRRTDDIVSILLAVLVGGFVTLGPLAFILSTN